jgi:hypothetical protein
MYVTLSRLSFTHCTINAYLYEPNDWAASELLQQRVEERTLAASDAEERSKNDVLLLHRQIKIMREDLSSRRQYNEKLEAELVSMRERSARLEEALQSATSEIRDRAEANANLEFRAGDQQQVNMGCKCIDMYY